jgi:hypothetical protein
MSASHRPPRPRRHHRALLTLLLGLPLTAPAQPYRYVDENGVTVYSQSPPAAAPAVSVDLAPPPPAAETAAALQRLQQQIEQDFDTRGDEARAAEAAATEAAAAAKRAEGCAAARQNLRTLEDLGARMLRMPDGSVRRPGDAERAEMMDAARAQITDLCD